MSLIAHNIGPFQNDPDLPRLSRLIAAARENDAEEGRAPRQLSFIESLLTGGLRDMTSEQLLSALPLRSLANFGRTNSLCFHEVFYTYDFKGRIEKIQQCITQVPAFEELKEGYLSSSLHSSSEVAKYFQNGLYTSFSKIENPEHILFHFVNRIENPKIQKNYLQIFNIMAHLLRHVVGFGQYRNEELVDEMKQYLEELNGPRKQRQLLWNLTSSFLHQFSPLFEFFQLHYESSDDAIQWKTKAYNRFYFDLLCYELGKLSDDELDALEQTFKGENDPFAPLMPLVLNLNTASQQIMSDEAQAQRQLTTAADSEREFKCILCTILTGWIGLGVSVGLTAAAFGSSGTEAIVLSLGTIAALGGGFLVYTECGACGCLTCGCVTCCGFGYAVGGASTVVTVAMALAGLAFFHCL